MSTRRTSPGVYSGAPIPAVGPHGRMLCRRCGLEVPKGRRRTFCSAECVEAWNIRVSPNYARAKVFERDHGVCAVCGVDTEALKREWQELRTRLHWDEWRHWLRARGFNPDRSLWDCDHIVSVVEGGGECGLENLQTLCVPCHRRKTAQLAKRRAKRHLQPGQTELLLMEERWKSE